MVMLSNNLNAIGDFISYSGNTVGELVSTYLSELIDEYPASGQGRFTLNLPTVLRFYTRHHLHHTAFYTRLPSLCRAL